MDVKTDQFDILKHQANNRKSLSDDYVVNITKLSSDEMLLSTRISVDIYNPINKSFRHINHGSGKIGKENYIIKKSKTGNLLVSSNNGLIISDPKTFEVTKIYNAHDGLEDDHIYSIEEDHQGHIWVSTNRGLSRIDTKTDEIINFNILDGLQGYEFNGDASYNDGEFLYFGGFNGFNYFKPQEIKTNDFITPVVITSFNIHGKTVYSNLVTEPLQLSYKDSFFSIEFAALDFTFPQENQYAYMLEGFDKDWIFTGNRNFASYTNLDGGNYNFRVKAANKYGIWNDKGYSIPISITPPFWETTWFKLSTIATIIFAILFIYTIRINAVETRNNILKREVKARTSELEEQKISLEKTLDELAETKDALIETAHKAGMADTATSVLHNIGNILNSVSTSAGIMQDMISRSASIKFIKANEILEENKYNLEEFIRTNPKGNKLLKYFSKLSNSFKTENQLLKDNIQNLTEKIVSINEVIISQQRYAQGHEFTEELTLSSIIDETLKLQAGYFDRHNITIKKIFDDTVPQIPIQKIKLVQILLNLYRNAKEAIKESDSENNLISIQVSRDNRHAYIKVIDNGIGIKKDHLEKIFSHGFTTKNGNYGFGLHSCANHMTEMNGKIWAESSGPKRGTSIVLQFPLKAEDCQVETSVA